MVKNWPGILAIRFIPCLNGLLGTGVSCQSSPQSPNGGPGLDATVPIQAEQAMAALIQRTARITAARSRCPSAVRNWCWTLASSPHLQAAEWLPALPGKQQDDGGRMLTTGRWQPYSVPASCGLCRTSHWLSTQKAKTAGLV